jgi:hypothetical protein
VCVCVCVCVFVCVFMCARACLCEDAVVAVARVMCFCLCVCFLTGLCVAAAGVICKHQHTAICFKRQNTITITPTGIVPKTMVYPHVQVQFPTAVGNNHTQLGRAGLRRLAEDTPTCMYMYTREEQYGSLWAFKFCATTAANAATRGKSIIICSAPAGRIRRLAARTPAPAVHMQQQQLAGRSLRTANVQPNATRHNNTQIPSQSRR